MYVQCTPGSCVLAMSSVLCYRYLMRGSCYFALLLWNWVSICAVCAHVLSVSCCVGGSVWMNMCTYIFMCVCLCVFICVNPPLSVHMWLSPSSAYAHSLSLILNIGNVCAVVVDCTQAHWISLTRYGVFICAVVCLNPESHVADVDTLGWICVYFPLLSQRLYV